MCDNENNKRNHMYLKSNTRTGHKMDVWKEWKLWGGKKSSTEKSRYLHKIIMLLPKKGHLGVQFMMFHRTVVTLQVTDSFPAPSQCVKYVRSMNIFAYILCTWNWAPAPKLDTTSPSGQWGKAVVRTEEIYLKCLRRGLALWMCSCDWWDQMSNAEGLQRVQPPHIIGEGGGECRHETVASIHLRVRWQTCRTEQSCRVWLTWAFDWVLHWR